jgi:hypothetical protein
VAKTVVPSVIAKRGVGGSSPSSSVDDEILRALELL